jgi:predicted acyl esterase
VADVNLQASLSVVRPDGTETWVSSGWLRAGHRGLDADLTDEWRIERTFAEADFTPLTPDEPVRLDIPIPPVGQPFRAGEQLRLTIATPGRNHGTWAFENPDYEGDRPTHSVLRGGATPSRIRVQVAPDIAVPAQAPACPSLRGQPCRAYVPVENTESAP